MIVFVAAFPQLSDEKDGLIQRVASIDSLVSDQTRIYLDISFRRFWYARHHQLDNVTVFQLNAVRHLLLIISLIKQANLVYVHSIYNSLKVLPAYWFTNLITDLHGVVPEELKYAGRPWRGRIFGLVERVAIRRSAVVIYVTSAMQRHFYNKYRPRIAGERTIAILPRLSDERGRRENVLVARRDREAIIYAGGLQAWQNVQMMVEAAASSPHFRFIFLSGEAATLRRRLESTKVENYECISVEPTNVPDYYLTATYGFVLRDPVLLNEVACPTKLVEYLYWGVIPIVLTPNMGDFVQLGFKFITLPDFLAGKMPEDKEVARMRATNRDVAERLIEMCEGELSWLSHMLHSSECDRPS